MAEYNAGSIEASLELNRDPFQAGLAAAKKDGEDFEKTKFDIPLHADLATLQADLTAGEALIQAMDEYAAGNKIPINVDLGMLATSIENARKLEADLARPFDVKLKVIPDLSSESAAHAALQAMASGDPIKIKAVLDAAASLQGLPRYALNAVAQQWGMDLSQVLAYDTKKALIDAMITGGYEAGGGEPPVTPPTPGRDAAGGAGGLAALLGAGGSVAIGSSAAHLLTTAVPLIATAIGGAVGGLLLAGGVGGVAAVGMGTDLAGIGQAARDIRTVYQAQAALNQAVAQYGSASTQAANAQAAYTASLQGFSPVARTAVATAATALTQLRSQFDQATGYAERTGAQIITQFVQTAEHYVPIIGKFATENMLIIQQGLQPFFHWLNDPSRWGGIGIFTDLEKRFQQQLPQGLHALEQGFELFAKTIDTAAGYTGTFVGLIDKFLTRWNGVDFGRWQREIGILVGYFRDWWGLGKEIFDVVRDLLHLEAGTGVAIVKDITHGLSLLDTWIRTTGGTQIHSLFEAHKEQILDLMKAVGVFISDVGPPLINLLTTIAKDAAPLLPVIAGILGPMFKVLAEILNVILKIPGLGQWLSLILVFHGLSSIPWFGIGNGLGLILRPLERLLLLPIDLLVAKLGGLAGVLGRLGISGTTPIIGPILRRTGVFKTPGTVAEDAAGAGEAAAGAEAGAAAGGESVLGLGALGGPIGIAAAAVAALALYVRSNKTLRADWDRGMAEIERGAKGIWDSISADWKRGMGSIAGNVSGWWRELQQDEQRGIAYIDSGISNLWHTLTGDWSRGIGAIESFAAGLWRTVEGAFERGVSYIVRLVENLPHTIGRIFADAGSWLVHAGESIFTGLWHGMQSIWHHITGWLSDLNPAHWKGPEARDLAMLQGSGETIMKGLQMGLARGWGNVTKQLSGYEARIASSVVAPRHLTAGSATNAVGGDTHVHITVYNPVPEAAEASLARTMTKIRFHGLLPSGLTGVRSLSG